MPSIIIEYTDEDSSEPKSLHINITCEYRVECYQALLSRSFARFRNWLAKQEPSHAVLVETALLNANLIESLAQLLDDIVLDFLEVETQDNKKQRWKSTNLQMLSKIELRNLLIEFYKHPDINNPNISLKDYLLNKYPKLNALLQAVTDQFIANILETVRRVIKHYKALATKFLHCQWPSEQPVLIKITLSESGDRHKLGAQVCFLDFKMHHYQQKRIVYKPFNVKADALIIGRTAPLNKGHNVIFSQFEGESFVELLNKYLPTALKLLTYLVFPCVTDTIKEDYGFIEYIEHDPWPHLNLNELVQTYVQNELPQDEKNPYGAIDIYVRDTFNKELEVLGNEIFKKGFDSDYIIDENNQSAFNHYSRQCGMLLAVLLVLKISDIHVENLIIHSKKPYLIDLEFAFQPHVTSLQQTISLDPDIGAIITAATTSHKWRYLYDATGIRSGSVALPGRNRLYKYTTEGKLIVYKPDSTLLKEGFAQILQIIHSHNQTFIQWLKKDTVRSLVVRVIPFSTVALKSIESYLSQYTSQHEWENYISYVINSEYIEKWLQDLRDKNATWLNEWKELGKVSKTELLKTAPTFIPLDFTAANLAYFRLEYNVKSIPAFYGKITEKCIYNALGDLVITTNAYNELEKTGLLMEVDRALIKALDYQWQENQYYQKAPWNEVKQFIKSLIQENIIKTIIEQTQKHIDSYYGANKPKLEQGSASDKNCQIM